MLTKQQTRTIALPTDRLLRTIHLTTALLLVALVAAPRVVRAQSAGAVANVGVGTASGEQIEGIAINGGVGYRFNRSIGFGIELTHLRDLESDFSDFPRLLGSPAYYGGFSEDDDQEGSATIFTTNVRVEIPTTMRRVIPFVVGGGGMASVTQAYPVIYYATALTSGSPTSASSSISFPLPPQVILPGPRFIQSTTTAMALTLGGGTSILVTDHLAVDVDLRAFKFLGQEGLMLGRFGVGASYRF
jgi:opacity protein-like surface antigen